MLNLSWVRLRFRADRESRRHRKTHRRPGTPSSTWRGFEPLEPRVLLTASHDCGWDSCLTATRSIYTDEFGVPSPVGLGFSASDGDFVVVGAQASEQAEATLVKLTPLEDATGDVQIAASVANLLSMTFDPKEDRLWFYESDTDELLELEGEKLRSSGLKGVERTDVSNLALGDARGLTVDPDSGAMFVLDGAGRRIVRLEPQGNGKPGQKLKNAKVTEFSLTGVGVGELRGIALNPENDHLYVNNPPEGTLYELALSEENDDPLTVVAVHGLAGQPWEADLRDPQAILIAPTGDPTDDPSRMSLYVADSGGSPSTTTTEGAGPISVATVGRIMELALDPIVLAESTAVATLVNTIDVSQFTPPSPDSSGITYMEDIDRLLESDSEVEEIPQPLPGAYANVNLFRMSRSGVKDELGETNTLSFSSEPTGLSYNPLNRHLFVSDDDADMIFEVDPGPDEIHGTADDVVYSSSLRSYPIDAEGLAYEPNSGDLFVVDGLGREVWRFSPGPDGTFDGVDDQLVDQFDVEVHGMVDPEGIAVSNEGTLFIVDRKPDMVTETTFTGSLVRVIDYKANFSSPYPNASGVVLAPASDASGQMNLYITDRGIDNDTDPNENDGKIYEMSFPGGQTPNFAFTMTKTVTSIQNPDSSDGGSEVDEAGDRINYSVALDNTGNQPLTVTNVSDPLVTLTLNANTDTNGDGLLDADETWIYTGVYTVTQTDIDTNGGGDGVIENTATADTIEAGTKSDSVDVPLAVGGVVVAESETTITGSLDSGDLTATFASDNVYEVLTESHSGGKPSNRTSSIVHEWTFRVDVNAADDPVDFFLEAYHTDNTEGDDFAFAFSVGGGAFTPMLTVEKTTDDDRLQFFNFPANTFAPGSNTVLIRATDTNTDPGNGGTDSLLVDWMYMEIAGDVQPPLPSVSITASDSTAVETPLETGEFTITRSSNVGTLTVDYTAGGSATSGEDYVPIGTQILFADGESSKTITISPIDDGVLEGTETVVLTLQGGSGYAVGSPSSDTVSLFDNNTVQNFAISEQTVNGSVVSGSLDLTKDHEDGTYEELSEELYSGGKRSRLEHQWTFDVIGGGVVTFHVEAHRTDPSEDDDDIVFEYSTDGQNWTRMVTVSETVDTVHTHDLTGIRGTVLVRVMDTNRGRINNSVASTIWIDEMFIQSTLL